MFYSILIPAFFQNDCLQDQTKLCLDFLGLSNPKDLELFELIPLKNSNPENPHTKEIAIKLPKTGIFLNNIYIKYIF